MDFLASQLSSRPGEITLVALGPLTNLARLERQHPGALSQAAAVVVMGGAVDCPGQQHTLRRVQFLQRPAGSARNPGLPASC